jgi:hypothetical protein
MNPTMNSQQHQTLQTNQRTMTMTIHQLNNLILTTNLKPEITSHSQIRLNLTYSNDFNSPLSVDYPFPINRLKTRQDSCLRLGLVRRYSSQGIGDLTRITQSFSSNSDIRVLSPRVHYKTSKKLKHRINWSEANSMGVLLTTIATGLP